MQRGIATATIPLHWTPMIPNVRNGLRLLALFPAALPFRVMAHNIPNDAYDFHSIGGHHGTVLCGYFYNGFCWYQNYDNAIARGGGDGWVSAFEVCDDGGICTGSTNAGFVGRDCFTLDPRGDPHEGVARCRGTGGICVAQNNDGCEADCHTACFPDGDACLTNLDCCGK